MTGRNVVETLMGGVVLLIAAFFMFISYKSGNISTTTNGYTLSAKFRDVGSLAIGGDVRIAGIKIGTVSAQRLDPINYLAILEFEIDNSIQLPKDSSASIVGDGLLGGKYVAIEPGGEETILKQNGEIKFTQDAISLESLIGKFAFGSVGEDSDGDL